MGRTKKTTSDTVGPSSGRTRKHTEEELDRSRFIHIDCQRRYNAALFDKEVIPERRIQLSTDSFRQYEEEIKRRQWSKLLEDPPIACKQVVREFHANMLWRNKAPHPSNCIYVRGKWIPIHATDINRFLRIPSNPPDEYSQLLSQNLDWEEIKEVIGVRGSEWNYRLNLATKPKNLANKYLNKDARVWAQIMFSRLLPNSHTSTITTEQCVLLFCLLTGKEIDLGLLISEHMITIPTRNASLPYPSLITAMALKKGISFIPSDEMVPMSLPINENSLQIAFHKAQRKVKRERTARAAATTSAAPPQAQSSRATTPPMPEPSLMQLQGQIDTLRLDMRSHRNMATRQFSAIYSGMRSMDARLEVLMRHQLPPEVLSQYPPIPAIDPALEHLLEAGEPVEAEVDDEEEESEGEEDSNSEDHMEEDASASDGD